MDILVFNCGSSSQGFTVFHETADGEPEIPAYGKARNVATKTQSAAVLEWTIEGIPGKKVCDLSSHRRAAEEILTVLSEHNVRVDAIDRDPAGCVLLSAMSGEVEFEGNADTITMSSMSGDVEARGVFHTVEMKSTSGEVELEGEASQVRMNSVSGDVTVDLRNATVRSIEARSTSGDVDIDLTNGTESGVHTSMSTVSGSVNCSIPDAGPAAGLRIQAASVSGDITVK